jgi:MFS family permease
VFVAFCFFRLLIHYQRWLVLEIRWILAFVLLATGGVLTLASFERDYRYSKFHATRTNSLAVGLQQLGAFVACFLVWPLTNKLGRKKTLMLSSFVFCIGALIQTINTHSLAAFYVARVIAGLCLGAATVVVPMFSSEMTPKEMRGQIGSFFQWFYTFVRLKLCQIISERFLTIPGNFHVVLG